MTPTTRNEAADRLAPGSLDVDCLICGLDVSSEDEATVHWDCARYLEMQRVAAKTEGAREAVERIRAGIPQFLYTLNGTRLVLNQEAFAAFLDEEAAR